MKLRRITNTAVNTIDMAIEKVEANDTVSLEDVESASLLITGFGENLTVSMNSYTDAPSRCGIDAYTTALRKCRIMHTGIIDATDTARDRKISDKLTQLTSWVIDLRRSLRSIGITDDIITDFNQKIDDVTTPLVRLFISEPNSSIWHTPLPYMDLTNIGNDLLASNVEALTDTLLNSDDSLRPFLERACETKVGSKITLKDIMTMVNITTDKILTLVHDVKSTNNTTDDLLVTADKTQLLKELNSIVHDSLLSTLKSVILDGFTLYSRFNYKHK